MNILDIIIIICSVPVLIDGYRKGFIRQVISLLALLIGVWIASGLGDVVGSWIQPAIEGNCAQPERMANIIGFAIVFLVILIFLGLIGKLVSKLIQFVLPEWLNKSLGIVMSALNIIVTLCILYIIFLTLNKMFFFLDIKSAVFTDSIIYPIIDSLTHTIVPNIHNILL